MSAIFWKEVKSYFYSPMAYILIGLFMFLNAFIFRSNLFGAYGDFSGNLSFMSTVLVFLVPLLTMRILSEDRKNGTEVLLITSPVSLTGMVVGKFLATFFVYLIMMVITFIFPIVLVAFGGQITPTLIGGYVGIIFLGAALLSIGIFASALTESQIVAAIVTLISLLIILFLQSMADTFGGVVSKVLNWFSLFSRYNDFNRGIFSLAPIVYFISFTAVFVFLTIRIIEKRRWSQG
jgi:ABC-2 type transport system permease protein